jgi:S-adenosylmethionine:tRNA ribosyltransferase-isomerase
MCHCENVSADDSEIQCFDYELPEELIAQEPPAERDGGRMLVIDRQAGRWEDCHFRDFPAYVGPGDCVVLNNSRVIPSRLFGHRPGREARIQVFLLEPLNQDASEWTALVRPGRKALTGDTIEFGEGIAAQILEHGERGERRIRFTGTSDVYAALERIGHVPLPPYIHRPDTVEDRDRYQTVFGRNRGSVAAPTAGLHFTERTLDAVRERGARVAEVTLHVGLGTFQPISAERLDEHKMHTERYSIAPEPWAEVERAKRIVAVGTTSVRTVESAALTGQLNGDTSLFLRDRGQFQKTGALLTNFHLPRTSLLVLVCAFAGRELILEAYRHAVREKYRFFSYGDSMLVI